MWLMIRLACILALIFTSELYAQSEDIDNYADAALEPIYQAQDNVTEQIQTYLDSPAGQKFKESGTKVEWSVAAVNVSTDHKDWAKHRVFAYKVAWADVQEKFIRYQMNSTSLEVTRELYSDASGVPPQYQHESYTGNDAIDEFIDKSGEYLSTKLNKALVDLDVDPEAYSRANTKQRKVMLNDAIRNETATKSFGKLSGLWVLKTFGGTIDGQHAVGVIGIHRPRFEEVAQEIAKGRIPHASSKTGRPLSARISKDKKQLVNSFGVRLARDESGYPVLISFGQWGVSGKYTNPAIAAKLRSIAMKQARNLADAELALFLNGTANFTDKSLVGSTVEKYTDVDINDYTELGDTTSITDMIDQVLKARAKIKLSGLHDFNTWTYRHPKTGHSIVGVVRVWTPKHALQASKIRSGSSTSRSVKKASGGSGKTATAWTEESPDYADPDEF